MALRFDPRYFDELLGELLTVDDDTRIRIRGNMALLDEFGPGLVALFGADDRGVLHELRVDTEPVFGLICVIDGADVLALAVYFDRGHARAEAIQRATRRSGR